MSKSVQGIENQNRDNEKTVNWNYMKTYSRNCGEIWTDKEKNM